MGALEILRGGASAGSTTVSESANGALGILRGAKDKSVRADRFRQIEQFLLDQLPMAGGMLGGLAAVPPSLAAAPLTGGTSLWLGPTAAAAGGGMGGEALRQLGYRGMGLPAPQTALEALQGVNRAGLEQGAAQAGGEALGAGALSAGRGLMGSALRLTEGLKVSHPGLIDAALKSRATVGRWFGRGGQMAAEAKVRGSSAQLRPILNQAERAGWIRRAEDFRQGIEDYIKHRIEGRSAHWETRAKEVRDWFNAFVEQNPGDLTPAQIKSLKQGMQQDASRVYAQMGKGEVVPPHLLNEAKSNRALANVLKTELETIPGVARRERITQKLIGPRRAVQRAENVQPGVGAIIARETMPAAAAGLTGILGPGNAGMRGGEALAAYLLARGATSPAFQSRLAVGLADPTFRMLLKQSPRAALFVLMGQGGAPVEATQTPP